MVDARPNGLSGHLLAASAQPLQALTQSSMSPKRSQSLAHSVQTTRWMLASREWSLPFDNSGLQGADAHLTYKPPTDLAAASQACRPRSAPALPFYAISRDDIHALPRRTFSHSRHA